MENGHNQQWLLVWSVGNQVAVDEPKPHGTRAQIRTEMARVRCIDQHVDGALNFVNYTVCRFNVVLSDEFPYVVLRSANASG